MKYQMELEVEIADNKISFTEEFFKSIAFVRKVRTIALSIKTKLSDKYRGVLSKEQGQSLQAHIHQMRNEWNTI
jgi:hypothetical protein